MKIIEKITLTIYSIIMLIAAILTCLLIFGWLDMGLAGGLVKDIITGEYYLYYFQLNVYSLVLQAKKNQA